MDVEVVAWKPDPAVSVAAGGLPDVEDEVVILPMRVTDDGIGVYRDAQLLTVKQLGERGVRARFLHDAEHRTFQSEHSREVVAAFVVWVLSSASWDSLKVTAQYIVGWAENLVDKDEPISVAIGKLTRPDGAKLEGIEIKGPASQVAERVLPEIRKLLDPRAD